MSARSAARFLLRASGSLKKNHSLVFNSVRGACVGSGHVFNTANAMASHDSMNIRFPSLSPPCPMSTLAMEIPSVKDAQVEKAIGALLAASWLEIEEDVTSAVVQALESTSDEPGKEILDSAWKSAQAVEDFLQKLNNLRLELDHLSGGKFGGETVASVPKALQDAMDSALQRYFKYLDAFGEDEFWLKKKVENEIGTSLLQIKQRCSGLGPEWNKISLLGTSGISGSFIEFRAK